MIAETRSNADGTFAFSRIRSGAIHSVVIHGNGGHRTFDRHLERRSRGRVSLGTFVLGPERDVPIRVHCRGPVTDDPDHQHQAAVTVHVWQLPSDEYIVSGDLSPTSASPPGDADVVQAVDNILHGRPGRDPRTITFPLTERELSGTFRLPIGTNIVVISGSCGNSVTTLAVPASGPVSLDQNLPVAGHDANVILELQPHGEQPCSLFVSATVQREH